MRPDVPVDKSAYHPVISSHILLEKRSPHFIPAEQSILKVSALYNSEFNAYSRRARYKTQVLAKKEISAMAPETRLNASNSDDGGANVDEGNVALPVPLAVSLSGRRLFSVIMVSNSRSLLYIEETLRTENLNVP